MKALEKMARRKAKPNIAKRILIAQAVLLAGGITAMLLREMPGAIREYRMWRMAKLRRS